MRIPRIYTGQVLQAESTFELEPGPSQHIARALRMQVGDSLVLFDGRGGEYPAVIAELAKKHVAVTTGKHHLQDVESPLAVHLGIAVSRGERMDWIVQKATELGIAAITPLFSQRTEVKLKGERADRKLRHWQQIAVSACEQCGRNRLPVIHAIRDIDNWLQATEADRKFVLHHRSDQCANSDRAPHSLALLVGPEGGLTPEEISAAEGNGYQPLRLGPRVLRTETAPLAAIAILQARWGDMNADAARCR